MNGATKTRLMYGAFLSHSQTQEYIRFLQERRLIIFDKKTGEYKLTETGLRYLRVYEEISELVSRTEAKTAGTQVQAEHSDELSASPDQQV